MELRFPLLGVLGLGSGMYGAFPVEFAVFGDAGIAWDSRHQAFFLSGNDPATRRDPLFSTGAGFRINLFGFLLAEIDYVKAFQRPIFDQLGNEIGRKGAFWQFSFQPGF
jgi:outer membrane protein assembly factor BamA